MSTGIAAHIRAAAMRGPRYSASQHPTQRTSADNGIWLCHVCSDRVDKDPVRYPDETLEKWRKEHWAWVDGQGMVAALPTITLETCSGLSVPVTGGTITGALVATLREHALRITTSGRHKIHGFWARMQLPEPSRSDSISKPPGVAVEVTPDRMPMAASATGMATVHAPDLSNELASEYTVGIDALLPGASVTIRLYSVPDLHPMEPPLVLDTQDRIPFYMSGHFQYERNGSWLKREFIVPFRYDVATRKIASSPVEEDTGSRNLWYTASS